MYYGYRYYHPALGKWLSRDPIGEAGGLNLSGFVGNGVMDRSDYLGLLFNDGDLLGIGGPIDDFLTWLTGADETTRGIERIISVERGHEDPGSWRRPHLSDHLAPWLGGDYTGDIPNTEWFEVNYPGWLAYTKDSYRRFIEARLRNLPCPPGVTSGTMTVTVRHVVYPYYGENAAKWQWSGNPRDWDPGENETTHGDAPQSELSADKVLGSFAYQLEDFEVRYWYDDNTGQYRWVSDLIITDGLGLNSWDNPEPYLGWMFPERNIIRARWEIGGEYTLPLKAGRFGKDTEPCPTTLER